MFDDPGAKLSFERMTGIEKRLSGNACQDFELVWVLKEELGDKTKLMGREIAYLSLTHLSIYHPSALVRHEAAFVIGEYSPQQSTFLDIPALHDSDPVVRHEACLAMGAPINRCVRKYNGILGYIAETDSSEMVRDSAKVALRRRNAG